jgi:hypothetical protein
MTIETGILRNDHEPAVVRLTDQVVEEIGIHTTRSHVEAAIGAM